jgi:catechol 2,3-dioxygenase-like lactoylglutathione lyase family enzyme
MTSFGDVHHVGITVRDLEESLQWYERVFDVRREFVATGSGPELSRAVGVPDADLRFAFLRFGSCVVELLCYANEREGTFDRSNADVGSAHVCIEVADLQKAYEDLRAKGVEFHRRRTAGGRVLRVPEGPQRRDARVVPGLPPRPPLTPSPIDEPLPCPGAGSGSGSELR